MNPFPATTAAPSALALSLALTSALALPACAQPGNPHGWTCELRPTRLDRASATATWDSGKGTVPGLELHCTQR